MVQDIYVIDNSNELKNVLNNLFKTNNEYHFKRVTTKQIDIALRNIPALIIIHEDTLTNEVSSIYSKIKENDDNNITPIIVVSSNIDRQHRVEVLKTGIEHYIKKPIDEEYFYYTIINLLDLLDINRRVSPLTGLPGNVQIQAEMKKRLLNDEEFSMMYFDLDNFKSYNDLYGFFKGDEIIKFTAKVISRHIHCRECDSSFVGHIGGDDFVAIVSTTDCEIICQNIIAEFDKNIVNYYLEEDALRGYIEVENRKGILEQFPIVSITIGVVIVTKGRFNNILEIGEMGAGVKHLAKTIPGSTYVINKREA
jgi:diguanylate cyclase (GGDEF)-like protein